MSVPVGRHLPCPRLLLLLLLAAKRDKSREKRAPRGALHDEGAEASLTRGRAVALRTLSP